MELVELLCALTVVEVGETRMADYKGSDSSISSAFNVGKDGGVRLCETGSS